MVFIIFRNPQLRYRKEAFGGIVKVDGNFFILGKKEYDLLNGFKSYSYYSSFLKQKNIRPIIDKFINLNLLLKIDLREAKKVLKIYKNKKTLKKWKKNIKLRT